MPLEFRALLHEAGPALCPVLKPAEFLREQRALDPEGFASLFQQDPLSGGDALFPAEAWVYYAGGHPRVRQTSILVDSSFKDGVGTDPSAVAVWGKGLEDGQAYCLDVWKSQVGFTALLDEIRRVYAKWKHLRPAIWIEGKANGQAAIDSLRKASATVGPDGQAVVHEALPVREWKPQAGWGASKVARMEGVSTWQKAGMCHLPQEGAWLEDFLFEHTRAPKGTHDDQVDTTVMALETFYGAPPVLTESPNTPFRDASERPAGPAKASTTLLKAKRKEADVDYVQWLTDQGIPF